MSAARQRARAFGLALEWRAALWLSIKGYRILTRNFSVQGGELDIVALSPERWVGRGVLCFVEVRGRAGADAAFESVGPVKQDRIRRAAHAYMRRHPMYAAMAIRFDVISSGRRGALVHTRHAFDA
jgi:putative endonuclease